MVLMVLVLVMMVEYLQKTVAERNTIDLTALDNALNHVAILGEGIDQLLTVSRVQCSGVSMCSRGSVCMCVCVRVVFVCV
jgi:hypothetical protein